MLFFFIQFAVHFSHFIRKLLMLTQLSESRFTDRDFDLRCKLQFIESDRIKMD